MTISDRRRRDSKNVDPASIERSEQQKRYDKRKAAGLCIVCGGSKLPAQKLRCGKCADEHTAYMAVRKANALAVGNCNVCYARPAKEGRKRCPPCADRHLRHDRDDYAKRRLKVIAMYGGSCVCCGETNHKYLQIDHVNDDGYIERGLAKARGEHMEFGKAFYTKLGNSERRSDLQLLCANCHNAKTRYGGCTADDHPIVQVVRPKPVVTKTIARLALVLTVALCGCTGADGKPRTADQVVTEIFKLSKEAATAACAVIERPESAMLATVAIPDYGPLAIGLARLACSLITARPDAIGVVVSADGSGAAITMPATSSGGELTSH